MADSNPILAAADVDAPAPASLRSTKLQQLEEAFEASRGRNAVAVEQVQERQAKVNELTQISNEARQAQATAEGIIALTEDTAALDGQVKRIEAVEAAGGVPLQTALGEVLKNDNRRLEELTLDRIDIMDDEHTGIGLIDGIINGFRSIQTDINIEAAEAKRARTREQIADITLAGESVAASVALTKKNISQATIEANSDRIAAAATIQGNDARIKNIHANNAITTLSMEADAKAQANLVSAYNISLQEDRIRIQENEIARLETERAKNEVAENELLENIQHSEAAQFGRVITDNQEVAMFRLNNTVTKEQYSVLEIRGAIAKNDPLGWTYGANPYEAKTNRDLLDPSRAALDTKGSKLADIVTEQVELANVNGAPTNLASATAQYNTFAKNTWDGLNSEIKEGSLLEAPPMAVLNQTVAVQQTGLFRESPAVQAMNEFNIQKLYEHGLAAVNAGNLSMEELGASLVTIVQTGMNKNNGDYGGFRRHGLPSQVSYNVRIKRPPGLQSANLYGGEGIEINQITGLPVVPISTSVDASDITSVMHSLVKFRSLFIKTPEGDTE